MMHFSYIPWQLHTWSLPVPFHFAIYTTHVSISIYDIHVGCWLYRRRDIYVIDLSFSNSIWKLLVKPIWALTSFDICLLELFVSWSLTFEDLAAGSRCLRHGLVITSSVILWNWLLIHVWDLSSTHVSILSMAYYIALTKYMLHLNHINS